MTLLSSQNRFTVIYDNGNATVSGFNGELDYKVSTDVNVFGRVEFKDYKMATEAQAWNLPKFKLTAGTAFTINDKVKVTGSMMFRGSSYDRTYDLYGNYRGWYCACAGLKHHQISARLLDLSGSVEYKVNKQISIFGRVNNILNSTNQTWVYYPDYGFNIFGGASFSF
jgi:outer membrane receptor protein involved in Fe transport